ncbi:MAG: hypothetical protein JRM99_06720, partial [Nitrososphaerota archaeon]|nr:hypothetical protein [Nitrososphaerota archaeon]
MSDEKLVVDDLIILGNAVPDIISDNRITVCTAGYSPSHGLIRTYPVPPSSPMRRWNIVRVPLERNHSDTRAESWKIQGSKSEWDKIVEKIELKGKVDINNGQTILDDIYPEFGANCVEELNDRKVSLGIIKPASIECWLERRTDYDMEMQTTLEGNNPFKTIKNYDKKPVMSYRCSACQAKDSHKQQILEWGVFEWMRKNPSQPDKVFENLHITDDAYRKSLLVGNMARHRNS